MLPWLLVAMGRLTLPQLTAIASQRGLSSVLELGLEVLGVARLAVRGSAPPVDPPTPAASLIAAVASLHRLVRRWGTC